MPYVYLIHPRAPLNANENVYKFGKTDDFKQRMNGYDKGSIPLLVLWVEEKDAFENAVLALFRVKYTQRRDYGTEYFEGNPFQMITDIIAECEQNSVQYALKREDAITITPEQQRRAMEQKQKEDDEKKTRAFMSGRSVLIKELNKVHPRCVSSLFVDIERGANYMEFYALNAYNYMKHGATTYMYKFQNGNGNVPNQPKTKLGAYLEDTLSAVTSLCNDAYINENSAAQQIIERIKACANAYKR